MSASRWTVRECLHGHGLHASPDEGRKCRVCWTDLSEPFEVMRAPAVDEDSVGLASAAHGETSREAAFKVRPRTGTQRARILDWIEGWGDYGRTRDEVAAELMMTPNAVRPRVRELLQGGHLYVSSKLRRKTDSGCDAEVLISIRFPGG